MSDTVIDKKNADVFQDVIIESREEIPEITQYIDEVIDDMTSLDYTVDDFVTLNEISATLHEDLPDCSFSICKDLFISDIVRLYTLFTSQTLRNRVRLQIEVVDSDMCRYFHIDNYRQRLLCTYKGPGTEWLDPDNVNLDCLGKGCNNHIAKDIEKINRAKTFEVLIIKGAKFESKEKSVVHRSPPIKKDRIKRILLKIDERGQTRPQLK